MDGAARQPISRRLFLRGSAGVATAITLGASLAGCAAVQPGEPAVPRPRLDPAERHWPDAPSLLHPPLFDSVLLGGFECSTHYRRDGKRLDLIASTKHDQFAAWDYWRLQQMGMLACRDAARWHLIEQHAGRYDFSPSFLPMLQAARQAKMQVIWDLMHYGWPDHVNVYSMRFPGQFARYALATAKLIDEHSDQDKPLFITPINEISFLSWAGGDNAYLNPYDRGRGHELKRNLVRATLAAQDLIQQAVPRVRFMHCDPLINVVGSPFNRPQKGAAEAYRMAQFQALDMMRGEVAAEIGGHPRYLDIIGVNYYRNNQTWYDGRFIGGESGYYKPLADMLEEVWRRYQRPMMIAETGIEADARADWMRYVAGECVEAMQRGVELHGICWYPILDHPGWEDDRYCPNGLWSYADEQGNRVIHQPLADEILRQTRPLTVMRARVLQEARPRQVAG